MSEVYNLGSKMRKLVTHHMQYQEKLEANTIEGLEEYSSIVHTLPVLVKLHEEAMASFNESKQKGSVCYINNNNYVLITCFIRKKKLSMLDRTVKHLTTFC